MSIIRGICTAASYEVMQGVKPASALQEDMEQAATFAKRLDPHAFSQSRPTRAIVRFGEKGALGGSDARLHARRCAADIQRNGSWRYRRIRCSGTI